MDDDRRMQKLEAQVASNTARIINLEKKKVPVKKTAKK